MEDADLSPEAIQEFQQVSGTMSTTGSPSETDYSRILGQIQDPTLKEIIQSSVDQITLTAAQDGYGGLFYSTVVIAALVVLLALILKPIRNKSLK